jgi:hypothetical protein
MGLFSPAHVIVLLLLAVIVVPPPVVGYRLGLRRDHEVMGLVLGLIFWWLGVLIVALLPKRTPA